MSKKTIKILGTGCPSCKTATSVVQEVVTELNLDYDIVKVEDIMEIIKYNVMSTPAVLIDDVVVVKGRVPSKKEVIEWFTK